MESNYIQKIQTLVNPNFKQIVEIVKNNCGKTCPGKQICKPWNELEHGVGLLDSHEKLCKYLCAYGDMHEEKMLLAFNTIENPQSVFNKDYTIIDWGCGQGLATLCFFDFLNQNNLPNLTKNVILIEPSLSALNRGRLHISAYLNDESKIRLINKFIDNVDSTDIENKQRITIHFFSNILDIKTIDLVKLTKLISENIVGEHYFFCVGPLNFTSTRIKEFAKLLDINEQQIVEDNQGQFENKRGTIKLLVFKIKEKEIEIIKTDFYPTAPNNLNYKLMLEKILNKVDPVKLNLNDKIIQFYKSVIELEQQKEPEINAFYQYPISDKSNNVISLDLQKNTDFFLEFNKNKDNAITKWPKDLFVGLKATLNEKSYLLMSYIIPYDDIKDINITSQQIQCKLTDFSPFLKSFDELELSEEQISDIENLIQKEASLEGILNVLKEKIEGIALDINNLYIALSSKNPALSQIYSELNKLNSLNIPKNSLLESFLLNQKINNKVFNLQQEDLIQISDIDDSQKKAVLNAFNNKLTVITGPPGSGKTQVILNILANAVLHNKKVLVASKNNKAVDNVKDRFDKIEDLGYFLRFGSQDVLKKTTIPSIESIINKIPIIDDPTKELSELLEKIETNKQKIKENKAKLAKKVDLQNQLTDIKSRIQKTEQQFKNLFDDNSDIDFFRVLCQIAQIDNYRSNLKTQSLYIESKYTGFKKIWFNWFYKQNYSLEILKTIEQYPFEIRNYLQTQHLKSQLSDFRSGDDIIHLYSQLINIFSNSISYIQNYTQLQNQLQNLQIELKNCNKIIDEITALQPVIYTEIEEGEKVIKQLGKPLLIELIKNKLKESYVPNIIEYKDHLPTIKNIWKLIDIDIVTNITKSFLNIFNTTSVTSLSAKNAFPLSPNLFDIVVIDEASQCDIASAIPLILRAKQLVVIGDPLQLKHISKVNDYEESFIKEHLLVSNCAFLHYNRKSLWDYSKDLLALVETTNNAPIMIEKHYRCHPSIIGYSNEFFYSRMLGNQLTVCTTDEQFLLEPKGIQWIDIQGQQKANNINVNEAEASKSIEIAITLAKTYPKISIGIVTPFKNQAERLNTLIPNNLRETRIIADTVHKFQGDEKDVMIYSLVVTNNSPSTKIQWIDESCPNLVNVAVTRARNTLYIVGNKQYIRSNSTLTKPLGKLLEYAERNNGKQ